MMAAFEIAGTLLAWINYGTMAAVLVIGLRGWKDDD